MIQNITRDRAFMTIWKLGTAIPSPSRHTILIHPEFAMEINRLGFTRKGLQKYLYERSVIPYEQLTQKEIESVQRRIDAGEIPQDRMTVFKEALKPGGKFPLLLRPEDIHIVVAGGIPGYALGSFYFSTPPYGVTAVQTKLVRGATLTKGGR
jgi:hypothetical protein